MFGGEISMAHVEAAPSAPARPSSTAHHRPDHRPRLPRWLRQYRNRAVLADAACGLAAGAIALAVRFGEFTPHALPYAVASAALPALWVSCLALNRAYAPRLLGLGSEEFRRVVRCGLMLTAALAICAYATKTDVARGYVVIVLPAMTVLTLLARYGLRRRLHARRLAGECMHKVLAVGHPEGIADLVRRLRREPYHGMEIVAACLPENESCDIEGVPVLGGFCDVPDAVGVAGADTVAVLSCPEMDGTALSRLAWRLEETSTELVVAPALMEVAGPRIAIRPAAGLPLLHVEHPELAGMRQLIKNLFDRTLAAVLLVLLAPVLLVLGIVVRATSPGPALFRQTRIGRDGREFTIYKLRTMRQDAEERKVELVSDDNGVLFKIRRDPRVTPIGAWLRRYSLDELPQLVNVLLGDMSLVGPRPPLPEEVACYGDDVRRRLLVKPGLTGLWQVSGRSDLSWEESVRLDLRYVENWSLTLDLQILWKTWSAVVRGAGAY
ncbi:Undecaprenyl-phosphate galactose phosphotransferase, WbaP/exopolysaccharide biosynthesis polyprenyl glycosylphosphotransferase [Thermostaphylospora chromogena]|uniref:Undecaprenyl-phosphate galactose phosphotransferase, WbaP/exopolysaccharide biosynthesis polyprenyl glycosylphosphotransferase n=2 Tax=Thermostaphylospora chromogena TaxID=35622 RepID=A0A1H1BAQ5_9ACTN|nr:Undecaprenyl-phosphate galactose phosphotransferase, WbaP/exopolysaccharide biosynthesis polyprenyl glycosylphosphotransferase [Thermostaphylospora chromogena]